MDNHINVVPNISMIGNNKKKVSKDPDVEFIINKDKSDDIDIMKLNHNPTIEEQETKKLPKKKWSWKVIGLIVVIVILAIALVWYVLKYNSKIIPVKKLQLPPEPRLKQYTRQTEDLSSNKLSKDNFTSQPSKNELLNTLKKLESIKEIDADDSDSGSENDNEVENKPPDKKILTESKSKKTKLSNDVKKGIALTNKPKVSSKMNKEIIENQETEMDGEDDDDEQDNALANKFYNQLQNNIDNEDDESE